MYREDPPATVKMSCNNVLIANAFKEATILVKWSVIPKGKVTPHAS